MLMWVCQHAYSDIASMLMISRVNVFCVQWLGLACMHACLYHISCNPSSSSWEKTLKKHLFVANSSYKAEGSRLPCHCSNDPLFWNTNSLEKNLTESTGLRAHHFENKQPLPQTYIHNLTGKSNVTWHRHQTFPCTDTQSIKKDFMGIQSLYILEQPAFGTVGFYFHSE